MEQLVSEWNRRSGIVLGIFLAAVAIGVIIEPAAHAQTPQDDQSKQPADTSPVEKADELKSKVTFAVHFAGGDRSYDLNFRHQFGPVVAWVAGFFDPNGIKQARIGAEYDFQRKWLLFIPTLEVGSNGAVAGQR